MKQIFSLLCTVVLCAIVAVGCSDDNDKLTKTFTVTFNSQGGSEVKSQTVAEGDKVTQPTAPTKEGLLFSGWYKEAACTTPWKFDNIVTEDITLYAGWASEEVTVSFVTNGGENIDSRKVAKGGLLNDLPIPIKTGSAFEGWYTDEGLTTPFDISSPINANQTLYAKWTTISKASLEELANQVSSYNKDNYTEASYNKMIEKRDAARTILAKETPTDQEITNAYNALSKAISELVALAVRPAVALNIWPAPNSEGIIYVNPAAYTHSGSIEEEDGSGNYFGIDAYGVDVDGNYATNSKVTFEYPTELEEWAADRTGEEAGQPKIFEAENTLSFNPKTDLTAGKEISITIKSADNTALTKTIKLKVITAQDAKTKFLGIVNALPAINTITFDNWEDVNKKVDEADALYKNIPRAEQETTEISEAYENLLKYYEDYFWKMNYSFESANICIIENDRYQYTANGTFPAGTYISDWKKYGDDEKYTQGRIVLTDQTYQMEERTSTSSDGANPSKWKLISDGKYRCTGNQTNGGTITMHELNDYRDSTVEPESLQSKRINAKAMRRFIK